MRNVNIKKWVKSLRSGDYDQGHHELKTTDSSGNVSFCCLGVAADLYIKETNNARWKPTNEFELDAQKLGYYDSSFGYLVTAVQDWLMANSSGQYDEGYVPWNARNGETISWITLNDEAGLTFEQIADTIEYVYGVKL